MANSFSREVRELWAKICAGFEDAVVLSNLATVGAYNQQDQERSGNTIWRPMPYIMPSYQGADQTANLTGRTQLAVPTSMQPIQSSPFTMSDEEARDPLQAERLIEGAVQKLASDINVAVMDEISNFATLVVTQAGAITGFQDAGLCKAIMDEQGVPMPTRAIAMATRDYIGMSGQLAGRGTVEDVVKKAYESGYVGRINSFDAYNLDYANALTASTATTVTVTGTGTLSYVPLAQSGGQNVDNRTQNLDVTVGGGTIAVGDCITINTVFACHQVTKRTTGQLKTFRVVGIVSGGGGTGTIQISPPIIGNAGGSVAEQQYQNVTAAPTGGETINFLNIATAPINVFWHKRALEIHPGKLVANPKTGVDVVEYRSKQGIPLTMKAQYNLETLTTFYRVDTLFGTTLLNREMAGILLANQT